MNKPCIWIGKINCPICMGKIFATIKYNGINIYSVTLIDFEKENKKIKKENKKC